MQTAVLAAHEGLREQHSSVVHKGARQSLVGKGTRTLKPIVQILVVQEACVLQHSATVHVEARQLVVERGLIGECPSTQIKEATAAQVGFAEQHSFFVHTDDAHREVGNGMRRVYP